MHWIMKPSNAKLTTHISNELGLYRIVAGVLVARGCADAKSARRYINPSLDDDWSNPEDIPGMSNVADGLEQAIRAKKRIVIFGDYDVDGITSSALMYNLLRALEANVQVVLPLREGEGYGLSDAALERIMALEPEVVLTVDCGITALREITQLLDNGVEVFITDHHEAENAPPLPVPAADPKLDPQSAASGLSGAGVALKLAALLSAKFDKPDLWRSQLDLAALGTIADCMPLSNENRPLVLEGVKALNKHPRPGIAALQEISGRAGSTASSEDLSYGLIPRLNAAGRVSDPMISFDVLCSQKPDHAMQLALKLEALNTERKQLETRLFAKAVEQLEPFDAKRSSIVVGGERWHDGVRGIVASRLVRNYGVPALVFSFENGVAVGSGRSVGTINLYAAMSSLADLFIRFGGHEAAVGVTIEQDRFTEFSKRLEALMQGIARECFSQSDEIDCTASLEQVCLESVEELSLCEPYGKDNPRPRFLTTGLALKSPRFIGSDKNHVSLLLSDGTQEREAIWFNTPYRTIESLPAVADVVYSVQIDEWRGRKKVKLTILDLLVEESNRRGCSDEATENASSLEFTHQDKLEKLIALGNTKDLTHYLVSELSGRSLHLRAAQSKCLETLENNQSTLAVMATGRGKSLIFQVHAARLALRKGSPSLFIYPLKALINDQEHALVEAFAGLGLVCSSLTGSTSPKDRKEIALKISEGSIQVVLSTPEFVLANAERYSFWTQFGFVAVDEAHHIATSSELFRPDYTRLAELRTMIPQAVFLGLSATSNEETTNAIVASLGIEQIVLDTSKRPNLLLNDKRNCAKRDEELTAIVQASPRSLIYASSRAATLDLCRMLRKALPGKASQIAFYNAALTNEDRNAVEQAYREGEIDCLVATSAFGEGVNIPNIRDVVLYDLPYSLIDFNQMAGRGGRDGSEAWVHVLAQRTDAQAMLEYLAREVPAGERGEAQESIAQKEQNTSMCQLEQFADWLFKVSPHGLLSVIQKPLTPLSELESV